MQVRQISRTAIARLSGRWVGRVTCILAVFFLLPRGVALAEEDAEEDAQESSSRIKPGALHLDYASAYLELESGYENRRVKYKRSRFRNGLIHENRDIEFRESLGLSLAGDVVDSALVDWRADLVLGLSQLNSKERSDNHTQSDSDSGFIDEFDIAFDVLKDKPLSFNAYARRSDDRIARRFLPSLNERVTDTGVSALAITGPVTTEFGVSYRDTDRSGNRLEVDDERLRQSRFFLDSEWEISDHQRLHLSYDHTDDKYDYQGSKYNYDTKRDEIRIEHELKFGDKKQHLLDTYVEYFDESGDLARDEFQITPRLTLEHTDKLKSVHRYSFFSLDQDAINVTQNKWDSELIYRPNDNWRISGDAYALYEKVEHDLDTREWGGGVDVSYVRPTSSGEFSFDAAVNYSHARMSGSTGQRVVRGEAYNMGGPRTPFLRNTDVVLWSITVRDASRVRIFLPGIDYNVVPVGNRIRLTRVPTGRIADRDVVYVDYTYRVPVGSDEQAYRTDMLVEYRFNMGLAPYYYYEGRCEDRDNNDRLFLSRDNTHRHRFGLRYERDWWNVTGEAEIVDDTIEPYDALHFTGHASLVRTADHSLDVDTQLSRYFYEGGVDDRDVWWFDIELSDRLRLNQFWYADMTAAYRWEHDSIDGETNGVDVDMGIEYNRGSLTVELTAEYDLFAVGDTREDGVAIWLRVRRDLTHLFEKAGGAR